MREVPKVTFKTRGLTRKEIDELPRGTLFQTNEGSPYVVLAKGYILNPRGKILSNHDGYVTMVWSISFGDARVVE